MDRHVTHWWRPNLGLASDILVGVAMAFPFIAGAIDTGVSKPVDGWNGYGKDVLIYLETFAVTATCNNLLNFAIRRPRPYVYNDAVDDEIRTGRESAVSFPSGHTSTAFALATSYSFTFMKRHPNSSAVVPVWVGTYTLASTIAILRPLSGDHFFSDVMAGAVLGIGVGLLIPWLHLKEDQINKAVFGEDPLAPRISIMPAGISGGAGALLTIR